MAKKSRSPSRPSSVKSKPPPEPTGLTQVDRLADLATVTLTDYLRGVSEYVRSESTLVAGPKKSAQVRLSIALGKALLAELKGLLPTLEGYAGERTVAGALRTVQADVSEFHELDGLRLAVEIKSVNLAVGRAIWNRFGDIRTFAVNLHLKFPFAVIGGVLVIPKYEMKGGIRRSTATLITRTIGRLVRAGGRRNDAEAPHLLEGIAVVVYDPDTGEPDPAIPPKGSKLRWEEFVRQLAIAYDNRFGEGVGSSLIEAGEDEADGAE